jgi:PIN domain nuclease of toxin-antitoxin system
VKGYLLDTNVALIALTEPADLSPAVRTAILTGPNVLSVVSYWEVLLKTMKGNLDVGDPRVWWTEALDQLAAIPLALRADHIGEIYSLQAIHRDPFDRALIGQAAVEDLHLVTTDGEIPLYASSRVNIIH